MNRRACRHKSKKLSIFLSHEEHWAPYISLLSRLISLLENLEYWSYILFLLLQWVLSTVCKHFFNNDLLFIAFITSNSNTMKWICYANSDSSFLVLLSWFCYYSNHCLFLSLKIITVEATIESLFTVFWNKSRYQQEKTVKPLRTT